VKKGKVGFSISSVSSTFQAKSPAQGWTADLTPLRGGKDLRRIRKTWTRGGEELLGGRASKAEGENFLAADCTHIRLIGEKKSAEETWGGQKFVGKKKADQTGNGAVKTSSVAIGKKETYTLTRNLGSQDFQKGGAR